MEIVILAGGIGSRFGGLKQLEPVSKKRYFIIDYSIYDAIKFGVKKVNFVIRPDTLEKFKEKIGNRINKFVKVNYILQNTTLPGDIQFRNTRKKPFGTGHALLSAANYVDDDFTLLNADDYYGRDAIFSAITHKPKFNEFHATLFELANTLSNFGSVKRGVCETYGSFLKEITEMEIIKQISGYTGKIISKNCKKITKNQNLYDNSPVSMNLFTFSPSIFDFIKPMFDDFIQQNLKDLSTVEFLLPDVINNLIKSQNFSASFQTTRSVWKGLTFKEDLSSVKTYISDLVKIGVYPEILWK
ncbi:MAG: nucleotidyltransferase [Clostridia bacterium]|nr:nucleotidyltransferase [Clostridia bacterium]